MEGGRSMSRTFTHMSELTLLLKCEGVHLSLWLLRIESVNARVIIFTWVFLSTNLINSWLSRYTRSFFFFFFLKSEFVVSCGNSLPVCVHFMGAGPGLSYSSWLLLHSRYLGDVSEWIVVGILLAGLRNV